MPQETERPIEKLLRVFAKKRREAAGSNFELHPATRRMLQAEVTRQFGTQASKPQVQERTVWRFWPKLAWGLGACALAILGVWVLQPKAPDNNQATLLARNETQRQAAQDGTRGLPAAARAKTGSMVELRDETAATASGPTNVLSVALAGDRPTPVLTPPQQQAVETISTDDSARMAKTSAPAAATASLAGAAEAQMALPVGTAAQPEQANGADAGPAVPSPSSPLLFQAGQSEPMANLRLEAANSGSVPATPALSSAADSARAMPLATAGRDQFAAVFRAVPNQNLTGLTEADAGRKDTASPIPVLASFELEQLGRQLRVIDQDGSVYTGDLQAGPADSGPARTRALLSSGLMREMEQKVRPVTAEPNSLAAMGRQTYFFRVSGTNMSLKQPVLFYGQLIQITNAAETNARVPLALTRATASFQTLQPGSPSAGLTRRVSGKAILGNKTEFTIEAVSPSGQTGH